MCWGVLMDRGIAHLPGVARPRPKKPDQEHNFESYGTVYAMG